jgi:hypothetical protein
MGTAPPIAVSTIPSQGGKIWGIKSIVNAISVATPAVIGQVLFFTITNLSFF